MLSILATIAKQERVRLSERVHAGLARARKAPGTVSGRGRGCDYRLSAGRLLFATRMSVARQRRLCPSPRHVPLCGLTLLGMVLLRRARIGNAVGHAVSHRCQQKLRGGTQLVVEEAITQQSAQRR